MKVPIGLSVLASLVFPCLFIACHPKDVNDQAVLPVPDEIDFNFHVKPILSDRCFPCHGPDKNALKAELRLDQSEGGREKELSSGRRAFVAKSLRKSEAFQRIISKDPEWQMPPPDFKRNLSPYEVAVIEKWIDQGAEYKSHWAFIPPHKPEIPKLADDSWCQNEIDFFILNKLDRKGLKPNEKADKEVLLRRATIDLTGLPPTLEEIDAFLADSSKNAFEKVIDRLLASPHFGERMARPWLDLARYADSNGYSQDGLRIMWPWRDWVIQAFNDNIPYDDFLAWQLAGDMIPDATQEQRLATGFLRNYRQNGEGGIVDEEYRIEYAADRAETTSTVFLGLTMQCARCHDHKYDPLSQEEYYQFFSFFNNINERGITASDGNSGPELVLRSSSVQKQLDSLDGDIDKLIQAIKKIKDSLSYLTLEPPKINLKKGCLADISFDQKTDTAFGCRINKKDRFKISGDVDLVKGVAGQAIRFTAFDWVNINKKEIKFDRADPFSFGFYFKYSEYDPYISILNHLSSKADNFPGYEVSLYHGFPMLRLVHSLPAVVIQVQGVDQIVKDQWTHIAFTYDGSGEAAGIEVFINGVKREKKIVFNDLSQGIANSKGSLTVGGRIPYNDSNKGFGFIDELKIFGRQLSHLEVQLLYNPLGPLDVVSPDDRIEHHLLSENANFLEILDQLQRLRRHKFSIEDTLVSVMVMEELEQPRPTFLLDRGMYDAPEKQVFPNVPKAIFSLSDSLQTDRYGLVKWFLNDDHPLTARVAVNRFWQVIFGRGLVQTTEDFGNQGALPSHPHLLDWLAVDFRNSGWDIKMLLKKLMLSATYQQSSTVSSAIRAADPDNIFLARAPSQRLSAEQIRDVALAASGLLVNKIGGPSVKPYQPPGLWEEKGEFTELKNYVQDTGAGLYRRSLYTFWRRTSPPPSMETFDAPTRDICTPLRMPTNTPLQALVLQNDPQFVEASRVLAEKVIREHSSPKEQVTKAYRLLTGITPMPQVVELLCGLSDRERVRYARDPSKAIELLRVGEQKPDAALDAVAVAATTIVCSTIMSFDETLMKR